MRRLRLSISNNRKSVVRHSATVESPISAARESHSLPTDNNNNNNNNQRVTMSSNGECPTTGGKEVPRNNSQTMVARTRWLALKTIDYTDEKGVQRKWDIASRTTKQRDVPDAVIIIPILKSIKNNTLETIVVEQYRPPIASYAMEFPAGLVDKNETPEHAAMRELWEETGYLGVVDTSFERHELCMSPGLCDETINIVIINVDLDDPQNANPKQHQDEGENITVKRVPLTAGFKQVLGTSSGMPISMLYSFAVGLEMGAKLLKK